VGFWAKRYHDYEIYTLIFLAILALTFIALTALARRTQGQKQRKCLWLVRKIGTYLALIGWCLFAAIQLNLITLL
jgi:hypothetical protein